MDAIGRDPRLPVLGELGASAGRHGDRRVADLPATEEARLAGHHRVDEVRRLVALILSTRLAHENPLAVGEDPRLAEVGVGSEAAGDALEPRAVLADGRDL